MKTTKISLKIGEIEVSTEVNKDNMVPVLLSELLKQLLNEYYIKLSSKN